MHQRLFTSLCLVLISLAAPETNAALVGFNFIRNDDQGGYGWSTNSEDFRLNRDVVIRSPGGNESFLSDSGASFDTFQELVDDTAGAWTITTLDATYSLSINPLSPASFPEVNILSPVEGGVLVSGKGQAIDIPSTVGRRRFWQNYQNGFPGTQAAFDFGDIITVTLDEGVNQSDYQFGAFYENQVGDFFQSATDLSEIVAPLADFFTNSQRRTVSVVRVPEPSTMVLALITAVGFTTRRSRFLIAASRVAAE